MKPKLNQAQEDDFKREIHKTIGQFLDETPVTQLQHDLTELIFSFYKRGNEGERK